jgi:hypothetical protein
MKNARLFIRAFFLKIDTPSAVLIFLLKIYPNCDKIELKTIKNVLSRQGGLQLKTKYLSEWRFIDEKY